MNFPQTCTVASQWPDKRSESLKVIQYMRNEAHRFSIEHHRNKRSKAAIHSEIENIEGVGIKTIQELFQKFKSLERIKKAKISELEKLVGKHKAKLIQQYFQKY